LPSLFKILGYAVYFWSNEINEPIHVHVSKGVPSSNSTKILLTRDGGCVVANNNSHIPSSDLTELLQIISSQFFFICTAWKEHFTTDTLRFFC